MYVCIYIYIYIHIHIPDRAASAATAAVEAAGLFVWAYFMCFAIQQVLLSSVYDSVYWFVVGRGFAA